MWKWKKKIHEKIEEYEDPMLTAGLILLILVAASTLPEISSITTLVIAEPAPAIEASDMDEVEVVTTSTDFLNAAYQKSTGCKQLKKADNNMSFTIIDCRVDLVGGVKQWATSEK